MCGIFGIFDPERRLEESHLRWADKAAQLLRHRGPDGQGQKFLMNEQCLLGHLRLAIIDLMRGAQPLSNEDGTVWVICNGEIYNYVELRRDLVDRGHRFSSDGDVEVLVHLYEEKGTALLSEIEGMYAFAIVDTKRRQIFLARDRFGEKPLYWARVGTRGLAFTSEMKSLLPLPEIKRDLDIAGLAQFLAQGYIPAPRTHLVGVRKLRAGEALVLSAESGLRIFRYWEPEFKPETAGDLTKEEVIQMLVDRFSAAVRLRLRSDVPVGAFLSGGIDSTLIASTIRQLQPGIPLKTFCMGFDDDKFNEAPHARQVAERLGTDHCELHFSSAELLQIFDALISHYDEPFADASMFPTFAVCRAARQTCKVMLSGEGGDEFFGGYRSMFSYSQFHAIRRFPGLNQAARFALRNWPSQGRGRNFLGFLQKSDWDLLHGHETRDALAWFQPASHDEARLGLNELEQSAKRHARLRFPRSAMEWEMSSYLPEQILVKLDRASMFWGLECRTPFLDRQLFAFAASLPTGIHFAHGQGKALLRRSLPDFVPQAVRWRSKQGFTPPLASWFRTSLRTQMESAVTEISKKYDHLFVSQHVADLNRQHLAGADHSPALFRWLVLSRVAGINS